METRVAERFESKRDPNDVPWVDLKAMTLKAKKGRGDTLYETGEMKDSLSWRQGDGFVEIGFGKRYAAFHEWGSKRMKRRGLPHGRGEDGSAAAKAQAA